MPELLHPPEHHKLGKAPKRDDERNLKLARYLTRQLERPPASAGDPQVVESWPMLANDKIGDCVFAGAGHEHQLWTTEAGNPYMPTEAGIVRAYSEVTGYDPADPSSDRGTVVLDALNYRRKVGIEGHQIEAFAEVDPRDAREVKTAVWLFDAVGIGVALPIAAQRQQVWDVAPGPDGQPGSWGGHYVPVVAYDSRHLIVVTWGQLKLMTWRFLRRYCDEGYALLSTDFLRGGKSPDGFDNERLLSDLAAIT